MLIQFLILLVATALQAVLGQTPLPSAAPAGSIGAVRPPSSCPVRPSSKAVAHCEVLIVGGGAGGLFSAFMLKELGSKVCVVERQPYFGGKLQAVGPGRPFGSSSTSPDNITGVLGTAGIRIQGSQKELLCLAHQLGVVTELDGGVEGNMLIKSRGRWIKGGNSDLMRGKPLFSVRPVEGSMDNLYGWLWQYLVTGEATTNPITNITTQSPIDNCSKYATVKQYMIDAVGIEAYNFYVAGTMEPADYLVPIDVCAWLEYAVSEEDRNRDMPYVEYLPRGGWKEILDRLRRKAAAQGVRFFSGSDVQCLYCMNCIRPADTSTTPEHQNTSNTSSILNAFSPSVALTVGVNATDAASNSNSSSSSYKYAATAANGVAFVSNYLIFASGPKDIRHLGGNLGSQLAAHPVANAIKPIEAAVYNAFFRRRFWEDYSLDKYTEFDIVTDEQCTVFSMYPAYPHAQSVNATRPVYAADPDCVTYWKAVYAHGGLPAVRQQVVRSLHHTFPLANVTEDDIYLDFFVIHPDGWHYLGPFASTKNTSADTVIQWATAPLRDPSMCMVAEAYYPNYSGWAQAAWQSAVECMNSSFAHLISDHAKEEIEFIDNGCDGATEFSTEIAAPEGFSLPGLNPSTGKPFETAVTEVQNVDTSTNSRSSDSTSEAPVSAAG